MPRTIFSGVVLPERAVLSVSNVHSTVVNDSGQTHATIALNICANQVTVVVDTQETNLLALRNLVRSEVEFVASVAGFIFGNGYDVEITKAFDIDLAFTQVFGVDIPVVAQRKRSRDPSAILNSVVPLCYGPNAIFLRRALTDLNTALRRMEDTAFYCYRALESLRQSFGADRPELDQWKAMAAAVGSSKDEMDPLRNHAFPARHGAAKPISDKERGEIYTYTWDIVEKYIDFRLNEMGSPAVFRNGESIV
jgi:hypothetical protein